MSHPAYKLSSYNLSGKAEQKAISKTDPFAQAGPIRNLSEDLNAEIVPEIKESMVDHFYAANADYGTRPRLLARPHLGGGRQPCYKTGPTRPTVMVRATAP